MTEPSVLLLVSSACEARTEHVPTKFKNRPVRVRAFAEDSPVSKSGGVLIFLFFNEQFVEGKKSTPRNRDSPRRKCISKILTVAKRLQFPQKCARNFSLDLCNLKNCDTVPGVLRLLIPIKNQDTITLCYA